MKAHIQKEETRKGFTEALLVGYDQSTNDHAVLLVGRKDTGQDIKIINSFAGTDATTLYEMLTTKGDQNAVR